MAIAAGCNRIIRSATRVSDLWKGDKFVLSDKELIIKNCCQCPFFHHDPAGETEPACYCFLRKDINLDSYYCDSAEGIKYGFPDDCPLFEHDQIVVKRVRLRLYKSDSAKWEVKENATCADCGTVSRGYRLVCAKDYDRINEEHPEFRCERCSILKAQELRRRGIEL